MIQLKLGLADAIIRTFASSGAADSATYTAKACTHAPVVAPNLRISVTLTVNANDSHRDYLLDGIWCRTDSVLCGLLFWMLA